MAGLPIDEAVPMLFRMGPDDGEVRRRLRRGQDFAGRYGCTDASTGSFSRQAFDLLHHRYPKSPWTGRTPYWYR